MIFLFATYGLPTQCLSSQTDWFKTETHSVTKASALARKDFSVTVRCTNCLSGSLDKWCKRPCLTALSSEWASLNERPFICSIKGRGFGIMKCSPQVKTSNMVQPSAKQSTSRPPLQSKECNLEMPAQAASLQGQVKIFNLGLRTILGPAHPNMLWYRVYLRKNRVVKVVFFTIVKPPTAPIFQAINCLCWWDLPYT